MRDFDVALLFSPHNREGYAAYFNAKEFAFARAVGRLWTNMASSGNPNVRHADLLGEISGGVTWPKSMDGGVVLSAAKAGFLEREAELHGDARFCQLWDDEVAALAEAGRQTDVGIEAAGA